MRLMMDSFILSPKNGISLRHTFATFMFSLLNVLNVAFLCGVGLYSFTQSRCVTEFLAQQTIIITDLIFG